MAWDPKYKASGTGNWNPEYVGQPTQKPAEFSPGYNVGPPGPQGVPGISPTVEIEQLDGGHRVKIEAANGVFTFDLFNGQQGKPGQDGKDGSDGVSPTVSVSATSSGHRISITDAQGTKTFDVENGKQGDPGTPGKDGAAGAPGKDGVSPSVSVTTISGGHRITLTDASGTKTFDVPDGKDGSPGKDGTNGVSPTVLVAPITGGHRVTITDVNGTQSFDVLNGEAVGVAGEDGGYYTPSIIDGVLSWTPSKADMPSVPEANVQGKQGDPGKDGEPGTPGRDGNDGVSPTVAVSAIDGGNRLTITDAASTKTVDILNGKDGTAGAAGADGKDGISPAVSVTETDDGHRVSVTDKDGTKSFDVPNGKDGSPGADGATGPAGPNTVSTTTSTNITGLLKGNGSTVEAAAEGTDYAPAYSGYVTLTAATTLNSTHYGKCVMVNSSSAITVTLPTGTTGVELEIDNIGAGTVTLSGTMRTGATTATAVAIESGDAVAAKWIGSAWMLIGNYGEA